MGRAVQRLCAQEVFLKRSQESGFAPGNGSRVRFRPMAPAITKGLGEVPSPFVWDANVDMEQDLSVPLGVGRENLLRDKVYGVSHRDFGLSSRRVFSSCAGCNSVS